MKTTITLNVHITLELTDSPALDTDTQDYLAGVVTSNVASLLTADFAACDIDNMRVQSVQHGWSAPKEVL